MATTDDLIIGIGADTSSFNKALDNAKKQFKDLTKVINDTNLKNKKNNTSTFGVNAGAFANEMRKIEGRAKTAATAIQREMSRAMFNTDDFRKLSAAQKSTLSRYTNTYISEVNKQEKYRVDRSKRASELILKRQIANYKRANRKRRELEQQQTATTVRGSSDPYSGMLSIKHAIKAVALYGTVYRMYGLLTQGLNDVIAESARFDNSIAKTSAVLGKTRKEGKLLATEIVKVGTTFGMAFADIEEGMLTIGRAGIDNINNLRSATEGLAALSIITGDAMADGAASMASLLSVYPELADETIKLTSAQGEQVTMSEDLLNKMGAVANATRLGLKDFSTISNYALTTAHHIGLTSDSYLALAGALSKVGLNASTIGTSIRRLSKFTDDGADSVQRFFNVVGKSQQQFRKDLQDDAREMGNFTKRLAEMTDPQFQNAIKELNIQMKNTAVALRKVGKENYFGKMMEETASAKSVIEQGKKAAEGLATQWAIAGNKIKSSMNLSISAVVKELEKVITKAKKDGVDAFDLFLKSIQVFAEWSIKALSGVVFVLTQIMAGLGQAVGGILKLGGLVGQSVGDTFKVSNEDIKNQEKIVKLAERAVEATNNSVFQTKRLATERKKLAEMKTGNWANSLSDLGVEGRQFGDKLTDQAKKMSNASTDMLIGVSRGFEISSKAMDDIIKKSKEAKKEGFGYDTNSYSKDGLPSKQSPEAIKLAKENLIYQKQLSGEYTAQQARIAKINLEIDAQKDKLAETIELAKEDTFSQKKQEAAIKEQNKLYELQWRKKVALQQQSEKSAGGSSRAALKEQTDLLAVYEAQAAVEVAKLQLQYEKSAMLGNDYELQKGIIDLANAQAAVAKGVFEDAQKQYNMNKSNLILKKKMLQAEEKSIKAQIKATKAKNKELKEIKKELKNVGSGLFDNLLSGDFKKAMQDLKSGFIEILITPIRDIFSDLFSNVLGGFVDEMLKNMMASSAEATAAGVANAELVGLANAKGAVAAFVAWMGPWALPAGIAAMAALGFSLSGGGSGGGAGSMPSYDSIKTGGQDGKVLNSEGKYLNLTEYNAVLEIAQINQSNFNKALQTFNDLQNEARELWKDANSSMYKMGISLSKFGDSAYDLAVKVRRSIGSFDAINEFLDATMTDAEKLAAANAELHDTFGAVIPSAEELKAAILALGAQFAATGDEIYLIRANLLAEAGNKVVKRDNIARSMRDAAKEAAEAAKAAAKAASEMRISIAKLKADWTKDNLASATMVYKAYEKETGLTGLTKDNFLEKFTAASANGLTEEQLENWQNMSVALSDVISAMDEKVQKELDTLNKEISFYENIVKLIDDAYTGSLSYLTTMEKAVYAAEKATEALASDDQQAYIKNLTDGLAHEKRMSATKEEYELKFNAYIDKLAEMDYVEEKTTDDVVDELALANEKLDALMDAIEKASYRA